MSPFIDLELLEDRDCELSALKFGTVWLLSGRSPNREAEPTVRGVCVSHYSTIVYCGGVCMFTGSWLMKCGVWCSKPEVYRAGIREGKMTSRQESQLKLVILR